MTPRRIQRQRTKGWRKPGGAVYVGRGSRWGNPYRVDSGPSYVSADRAEAVRRYTRWLTDPAGDSGITPEGRADYKGVSYQGRPNRREIQEHLEGRDLMCWCPLDQPCHADVLLEIANEEQTR